MALTKRPSGPEKVKRKKTYSAGEIRREKKTVINQIKKTFLLLRIRGRKTP